ncbi:ribonuclease III [Gardnerella sp. DNF01151]|uniref:ribonuclease III n=1 Tax=Gardnerella sp. DNF01151 TaxID=2749059 RepID=UPI003BAC0C74
MKTQNNQQNQQNQQNMQSKHNQNNQNNSHAQHNEDGVLRLDGNETRPGDPTQELLNALGTTISPDLLVEALTHRSFSHEHPGTRNYERLEFLGDAVLELVSTETLFSAHPDMTEGQLAKMRAKAVSEWALSAVAREKLHVGAYILLGRGEMEQGGNNKDSILCDIVEALIGATFVEHGIDEARRVVHRLIDDTLAEVLTEGPALDWKTSLTVKAHDMGLEDPEYRMAVSGPEYAPVFEARAVLVRKDGDEVLGVGSGSSKRKAQLAAAEIAWHALDARK